MQEKFPQPCTLTRTASLAVQEPDPDECSCVACCELRAALDRHTAAIRKGLGDTTRGAVRSAAARADVRHGLQWLVQSEKKPERERKPERWKDPVRVAVGLRGLETRRRNEALRNAQG